MYQDFSKEKMALLWNVGLGFKYGFGDANNDADDNDADDNDADDDDDDDADDNDADDDDDDDADDADDNDVDAENEMQSCFTSLFTHCLEKMVAPGAVAECFKASEHEQVRDHVEKIKVFVFSSSIKYYVSMTLVMSPQHRCQ